MAAALRDAYVVAATRLPIGKAPRGMLCRARPDDLLAFAIRAAADQVNGLPLTDIEDVVVGCAMPEGEQGLNVARIGALLAGLPQSVSGITLNRFCASGLKAVAMAADRIRVGEADVMIAAGTESMSRVPMGGFHPSLNPRIYTDENYGIAYGMGLTAERVAQRWTISREAQDAFALRSHQRALAAQAAGEFTEITPYPLEDSVPDLTARQINIRQRLLSADEGPRADTSAQALARLKPAFSPQGSVTAGNASQSADGAAALVLMSEAALTRYQVEPLARFAGFAVAGVAPELMGIGPVAAVPKLLSRCGRTLAEVGWIELNEAFAAQTLAVIQELGLDPDRVNPMGGAIALGHPLGASGAIRSTTLLHGMRRRQCTYGVVTLCVGTGMGAAALYERA